MKELYDVPTDCPTREKSGYSGVSGLYPYCNVSDGLLSGLCKWIREQAAGQYKDGVVPQIAPKANTPGKKENRRVLTTDGGIGWSDSLKLYHIA
ncbi:MAG: hypothetical protein ACLVB1_03465 [Blautia obeum]